MYLKSIEIDHSYTKNTERYIKNIGAINSIDKLEFKKPVSFFVGENGTGKSTLLEAIAVSVGFNPEGGSKNFIFATHNSHSNLHENIKAIKGPYRPRDGYFLRAESFYNVASNIDDMDSIQCNAPPINSGYGGKSLHTVSHGESILTLVLMRFKGNGLYILDEPEIALSPLNQLTLLSRIHDLATQKNSQFIIITHSPILMACPDSEVLLFEKDCVKNVEYSQTEHYQLTKQFLNSPDNMISKLL